MDTSIVPQKRCTKCSEIKPIQSFGPNKRSKDKHHYWCRACMNLARTSYYEKYPDRKKLSEQTYRKNGKAKKCNERYRRNHPDRVHAQIKRANQRNPDIKRISNHRREAQKRNLPNAFTAEDWRRALAYFNGRCAICGKPPGLWHKLVPDHWIPLADIEHCPGTVKENIVPLCHGIDGCNTSKRHKEALKWMIGKFGERKANVILQRIHSYFESLNQS